MVTFFLSKFNKICKSLEFFSTIPPMYAQIKKLTHPRILQHVLSSTDIVTAQV